MEIDIIDYAPEQFAALSSGEIERVRAAQRSKNTLKLALDKKLCAEKQRLMDNGAFLSSLWAQIKEAHTAAYEKEVQIIREGLLFYLQYAGGAYDSGREQPDGGYPVDYTLDITQRMIAVRDYYLRTYEDASKRFEAFKGDEFAKAYLGEGYPSLWQYFKDLAQ